MKTIHDLLIFIIGISVLAFLLVGCPMKSSTECNYTDRPVNSNSNPNSVPVGPVECKLEN